MIQAYQTRHARGEALATHRHREAYAALVVAGGYIETSPDGPIACRPGTIVLHPAFHAHGDRFGRHGARVLNLTLPRQDVGGTVALQAPSLREAQEILARCPARLPELLTASAPQASIELPDWQQALAAALRETDAPIGAIARRLGVSAAHASRALLKSHGMSPQALRREARWRRAFALLRAGAALAEAAVQAGFADQSHLTRVTRAIAGLPPGALRREIKCVQDRALAGMLQSAV